MITNDVPTADLIGNFSKFTKAGIIKTTTRTDQSCNYANKTP
jgi:hypothetical protein